MIRFTAKYLSEHPSYPINSHRNDARDYEDNISIL
jgi:hypothetical protein